MDKTKLAVDVFDKRASEYQTKYMDITLYEDTFDLFCHSIPAQHASVLELACGPGNITQYLRKKRPDLKILATDLSPNMIRLAAINNPGVEFQLLDCRDITTLESKYDAIMAGFCLPYLSQEQAVQLISDAAAILNTGGMLYLSTMEDDYEKSGWQTSSYGDRIYVYYHQADYLVAALEASGFKIIDLQRKDFPAAAGATTVDLVILASKL